MLQRPSVILGKKPVCFQSKPYHASGVGISLKPSLDAPRRNPEHPRRGHGIDSPSLPPGDFVSDAVEVAVVNSAQRYGEFIADLAPHRPGLGELEMVGVGGASAADQTRV